MRITVVGAGYVGLVTGACFANSGLSVTFVDVDPERIDQLKSGGCPIYEPGLKEMMVRNADAGRISYTTDGESAYRDANVIFICVGTPSGDDGEANLSAVWSCADAISKAIASKSDARTGAQKRTFVVVKSTVPVGTTHVVSERLTQRVDRRCFEIANNPEFLKEGAAIDDFLRPDRVVIGVEDEAAGEAMRRLYEPFVRQGNPIHVMDIRSSEMVKYASNAMLATKISFINEIASLCQSFGADIDEVRRGMCADQRIGNQFLFPGLGFGGSCFPKDVLACLAMGRLSATPMDLLAGVHAVNQRQRLAFFERIKTRFDEIGGLKGKTIAVWGVAFKPSTDDIREAPAISIIRSLAAAGARVRMYDAQALSNATRELGDLAQPVADAYDAAIDADALVVCTDWDEFKSPDFDRLGSLMKTKLVFDGRNLYKPKTMHNLGFEHHSIGRPSVSPSDRGGAASQSPAVVVAPMPSRAEPACGG